MTMLSASTAAAASRTGPVRDRLRRRGLRGRWLFAAANDMGGHSLAQDARAQTDGDARVPSSTARHGCLTVQLRA